jgi:(p)ppGpp synthase/HD superfamily hydrolase
MGGDEDEAIAALLHDAVEDQGGMATLAEIRTRYGERVAEIVAGCSDSFETPKPAWRPRKEAYIAHLETEPVGTLRVSLADKINNARDISISYRQVGDEVWSRFKGGKEGTLWYYRRLVEEYRRLTPGVWTEELARIIADLDGWIGEK